MTAIKERPILFSAPMVRAILEGRKTVTRRPVKGFQIPTEDTSIPEGERHRWSGTAQRDPRYGFCVFGATEAECAKELEEFAPCPYGKPGDRLYVRETFNRTNPGGAEGVYYYRADGEFPKCIGGGKFTDDESWKPSIHMPRAASRILLEITDVRVERLKDISEQQALAEGIYSDPAVNGMYTYDGDHYTSKSDGPDRAFAELWNTTGGDWDANPWVWCVNFKRVTP
ncbi:MULTISPECIES: hypothetical protein [Pseudomonas]|uniref:hypothetical protein n=1 Tax=Pseudomonas TaxID=286 RepID=UPI00107073D2|nr:MULTISPECIES: hypothetical protein [Pseudomonas]QBR31855.1 hypothetical protein E3Z29_15565 [Pseudomonas sp. S150]UZT95382.1 hypothetical protein OPS05_12685 [Pseudomonas koreensis]